MIWKSRYRFSEKTMLNQKLRSEGICSIALLRSWREFRRPNAIWHNFALDFPSD